MPKPIRSPQVLVVEDYDSLRLFISTALTKNGYRVVQARSETEAIDAMKSARVAALFLDLDSLAIDGDAILAKYRQLCGSQAPVVACLPLEPAAQRDLSSTILVRKPFSVDRLVEALRASLDPGSGPKSGTERADAA